MEGKSTHRKFLEATIVGVPLMTVGIVGVLTEYNRAMEKMPPTMTVVAIIIVFICVPILLSVYVHSIAGYTSGLALVAAGLMYVRYKAEKNMG